MNWLLLLFAQIVETINFHLFNVIPGTCSRVWHKLNRSIRKVWMELKRSWKWYTNIYYKRKQPTMSQIRQREIFKKRVEEAKVIWFENKQQKPWAECMKEAHYKHVLDKED